MKKILLTTITGISFAFSSATIINGTTQNISFNSEPEGAKVLLNGVQKCTTPCTLSLAKDEYESVTFKKEGYKSKVLPLETSMHGTVLLNILGFNLGIFSTTTDMANGSAYEYSPAQYFVELKQSND